MTETDLLTWVVVVFVAGVLSQVLSSLIYSFFQIRAFKKNKRRALQIVEDNRRELDANNCIHCGENIRDVPQMYYVGQELVCIDCLQRLKKSGWGRMSRALGVRPIMVANVRLKVTPEGVEEVPR